METNYDDIAQEYQEIKNEPWRLHCEEHMIRELVGDLAGKSVLDLACGEGHLTRRLKRHGARRVVGVDLSQGMIDLATAQEAQRPLGIEYATHDVRGLDLGERFDRITAGWLLSYSPTTGDLLEMGRTIARHLTPDGHFATIDNHHDIAYRQFGKLRAYNVGKEVPHEVADGTPVRVWGYLPGGGTVEMEVYHYSHETYESVLHEAGLDQITWHRPMIAPEGMELFGADYWDYWIKHPFLMGMTAKRRS
ncbi:Ubiquinone biosynthesis O-methyltransferase [Planctomycetes bacterium Pan216]|uniref:Ubiquinone biosynthesis O-methyltransferase n=1 Tax=Kolteria novifilia TaxID=2527975 RepID=A0A518B078_9BACT|nr:Ubiquinone biosynthesis O-methyltransferase [Planctomycetes bacterium Pan216]